MRPFLLKCNNKNLLVLSFLLTFTLGFILLFSSVADAAPGITRTHAVSICNRKTSDGRTKCLQEIVRKCDPIQNTAEKALCYREAVKVGQGDQEKIDEAISLSSQSGEKKFKCGYGPEVEPVETRFDFGCLGTDPPTDNNRNVGAIEDFAYAVIRFLSVGVGLVLAASIVYAGIHYSMSSGNAEKTAEAKNRITNAIMALILYVLIFALIQYLVPGGLFAG